MKKALRSFRFYFVLLNVLAVTLLPLLLPVNKAQAALSTIGTSSSSDVTSSSAQRKTFYDTVNHVNWAFYYNGSAIEGAYSSSGSAWVSVIEMPYNTADFSLAYKVISSTPYVFIAAKTNTYDIIVARGTVSSSSINFTAEETVFDGASVIDNYSAPSIALDAGNYIWVAAAHDSGINLANHYQAYTRKSTNIATGSLEFWRPATAMGRKSTQMDEVIIMPRTGAEMYLLVNSDNPNVSGYAYNGSSWSEANTGGDYGWFNFPGALNGEVYVVKVVGGNVYVGGNFTNVAGIGTADYLVKWDGSKWRPLTAFLGTAFNNAVRTLDYYNNILYVGGDFTNAGGDANADYLAKYNGSTVEAVVDEAGDALNGSVWTLFGKNGSIYVGGGFTNAGSLAGADYFAQWDGTDWQAVGDPVTADLNSTVYASVPDGSGGIYVGGNFVNASSIAGADYIAYWTGAAWEAVGDPVTPDLGSNVYTLKMVEDNLYVGGLFTNASGIADADYLARWDSFFASWYAVGAGLNDYVNVIDYMDEKLYIGGNFTDVGADTDADYFVYYDLNDSSWNTLGAGVDDEVNCLDVEGNYLYVGGYFSQAGSSLEADYFARWDGSSWTALGSGLDGPVNSITVDDSDVYVGGDFTNAGGNANADGIVRWDGSTWNPLGRGVSGTVYTIEVDGNDIYIGGNFILKEDPSIKNLARFDGEHWSSVGDSPDSTVYAIKIWDSDLYIGGAFANMAGQVAADYLAKWNGSNWSAVGNQAAPDISDLVYALDINTGDNELLVGGQFIAAGGVVGANNLASFDGAIWTAIGSQATPDITGDVDSIYWTQDAIYIGGEFQNAGGDADADYLAQWNGLIWSDVGTPALNGEVYDVIIGGGGYLYIAGNFTNVAADPDAAFVAYWDGFSWQPMEAGFNAFTYVLGRSTDGLSTYVGGYFTASGYGSIPSSHYFAKWGPTATAYADETTTMSAISDASGNIHMIYVDNANTIWYHQYDAATEQWEFEVPVDATPSTSVSISMDRVTNVLYAFWVEGGNIAYRTSVSPYIVWSNPQVNLYIFGDASNVSAPERAGGGYIRPIWSYPNGGAFDVLTDGVKSDNTAPSGSIKINNGASTTYSRRVKLYLSASDANSGVYQMRFKNSGGSWSTWKTYSTRYWWYMTSSHGTKTVYAQFKDRAGNISSAKYDHIVYR